MVERRYQVFVSSTYLDLKVERDRILRTLAESNYIAAGMEYFPAIDEEQFKFIKAVLDDSDYCVCIVSGKYGSLAPDGLGYSEKEYNYAVDNHIPVIVLLRSNIDGLDESKKETDPRKVDLLTRFRAQLSTGRLVRYWDTELDLCLQLVTSLATTSKKYPRDGWIRGKEDPEALLRRIVELEDELLKQGKLPLSERIKTELANQSLRVTYKYASQDESAPNDNRHIEDTEDFSMFRIAEFLLPRLKSETRGTEFSTLVGDALSMLTQRKVVEVTPDTVSQIKSTLDRLGLINVTTSRWGDPGGTIVVTYVGLEIAREENQRLENQRLKALEKAQEQLAKQFNSYKPPTPGAVFGMVIDTSIALIAAGCRWLVSKLLKPRA